MGSWLGIAVLAGAALAVGLLFAARRRRARDGRRLRLFEVMRLRGAWLPEPMDASAAVDVEAAKRRCVACASRALCDEMLRSGRSRRYALFCANALYIEWLRRRSLHFD